MSIIHIIRNGCPIARGNGGNVQPTINNQELLRLTGIKDNNIEEKIVEFINNNGDINTTNNNEDTLLHLSIFNDEFVAIVFYG